MTELAAIVQRVLPAPPEQCLRVNACENGALVHGPGEVTESISKNGTLFSASVSFTGTATDGSATYQISGGGSGSGEAQLQTENPRFVGLEFVVMTDTITFQTTSPGRSFTFVVLDRANFDANGNPRGNTYDRDVNTASSRCLGTATAPPPGATIAYPAGYPARNGCKNDLAVTGNGTTTETVTRDGATISATAAYTGTANDGSTTFTISGSGSGSGPAQVETQLADVMGLTYIPIDAVLYFDAPSPNSRSDGRPSTAFISTPMASPWEIATGTAERRPARHTEFVPAASKSTLAGRDPRTK